jgi:Tfp pilus assembly pilus retraction ATPase PilT
LQDQTFTSLDVKLQQNIEVLLHRLIDMYNKLEEVLAMQKKSLDASKIKVLADKGENRVKRDMMVNEFILASLRFPTIRHREEAICEAHQRTFSWIFRSCQQETANARPWSNFVKWLSEGGGIYWMNGKAGSGKSTLMKYVWNHRNTLEHLQSWARGTELQVARFYFFNGGNEDQRSHAGLLRSLLHGILSQRTDLIRQVFQEEWNESRKLAD